MAIYVKDAEANRLIREVAEKRGISITEAIKVAAQAALRETSGGDLRPDETRIAAMLERWDRLPRTVETSTKEFSDALYGDEEETGHS